MKEHVTGMVLAAATVGEYDKRVVLLTKERGRISAFARGARRPKSALSAPTEPFTFGDFYVYRGRDSYSIDQVEVKYFFPELRKDLDNLYMALYFCEVAEYFTREGMEAVDELNLLYLSFRALLSPSIPRGLVRYIYELRMLLIAGEAPGVFSCACCGGTENLCLFYPERAEILCSKCSAGGSAGQGIPLSETAVYTMQRILSSPIEKLYTFRVSERIQNEVGGAAGRYFGLHTDKKFRTLPAGWEEL